MDTLKATAHLQRSLLPLVALILLACTQPDASTETTQAVNAKQQALATLLVTPDRGFGGNEDIRQAVKQLDQAAEILFMTDQQSRLYLDEMATQWRQQSPSALLILPLFLSAQDSQWQLAKTWLEQDVCTAISCTTAIPFGQSVFAVENLIAGLSSNHHSHSAQDKNVLLITHASATLDKNVQEKVTRDIQQLLAWATQEKSYASANVFVWHDTDSDEDWDQQSQQLQAVIAEKFTQVVSYHFGHKLDGMMSLDNSLARIVGEAEATLHPIAINSNTIATWIQREQNRVALNDHNIGVIVHAHGSDFHWNESMRRAITKLQDNYTIEFAFSMADQLSIDQALQRLQERGMRGAIVVRVFGRQDSFESDIQRMLGLDVESGAPPTSMQHTMHHGSGGHHGASSQARINTALVVTSVGGLDDHPLFARALLQRVQALSQEPSREEIIVVAHGTGAEEANQRWLELLDSIAMQMQDNADEKFSAIHYATWQEDWPDKREKWIAQVREWIKTANQNGKQVIVIPARTNATGPETEFLDGLDFKLGEGFAGHPLFADWLETQIQLGIDQLR
jgi:sirohydrochlorin ferrochelatase